MRIFTIGYEGATQAELIDMAREQPVALLCFERDAAACHRSRLVDAAMPDAERIDLMP